MALFLVALSGGVDSAVTAARLLRQGHAVEGVVLRLWRAPQASGEEPVTAAEQVARALGIPLHVVDARERFFADVVQHFIRSYTQGLTPNPCVLCNPGLKFALLAEVAAAREALLSTGHYARILHPHNAPAQLWRARHRPRDQSYMLYRLTQPILTRLHLPLGEVASKDEVRAEAAALGLPVAARPDSQDLCFLGGTDYRAFLQAMAPEAAQPGPIYDEGGKRLGTHRGLGFYTVGQREGLGIAAPQPLYVVRLDATSNALIVGPRPALERATCRLAAVTFPEGTPTAGRFACTAQIRYRATPVPVEVELLPDAQAVVHFAEPQRGLAPGQSVVFYDDERVVGGGIISP